MIRNIEPISLVELNRRIAGALAVAPGLNRQWITAETSDLRCSAGHCYMELVHKNDTGTPLAKARAVIWASTYAGLRERFLMATGVALASDMKVMVQVNVNYHPVYGMSLVINDIDPDYTVGDLARRRNAIIMRLRAEGVFDLNRTLPWSPVPQRVAVVSARGAAGYGDFVRHLHGNAYGLRFHTELFESAMQGERTVQGIIDALEKIAARENEFDCVAIIRGGGAVSELAAFDNYDLAANVAQFPLPVIVGIGHDRDTTVLDYVAARRVKTPTAAAEFLVASLASALERVASLARSVQASVVELVGARKQQLAYYRGQIPALARAAIDRQRQKVGLPTARLIAESVKNGIARRRARLEAIDELLAALAPEATLRRGYSITRVNGHAVTDSALLAAGTTITTTFAKGNPVTSTIDGII